MPLLPNKTLPYLYRWTNILTKKWYIGSKSSNNCNPLKHEKYICSSKIVKPLIKQNRKEWYYEILVIGDKKYIRQLETKLLKLLNAKDDPMSYNQCNAAVSYDRTGIKDSKETKFKKSMSRKGNKNPAFDKKGQLSPLYGRKHSDETRELQSISIKKYASNRPITHNRNISKSLKGNPKIGMLGSKNGMYGKTASKYNKQMSKLKNSGENNPMRLEVYQMTCIHCNKTVAKNHYTMYHGDKCKLK